MEIDRRIKNVWEIDNVIAKEAEGKCHTPFFAKNQSFFCMLKIK